MPSVVVFAFVIVLNRIYAHGGGGAGKEAYHSFHVHPSDNRRFFTKSFNRVKKKEVSGNHSSVYAACVESITVMWRKASCAKLLSLYLFGIVRVWHEKK